MDLRHLRHGLATRTREWTSTRELLIGCAPDGQAERNRLVLLPNTTTWTHQDAFTVTVMVTRADYLAGSLSRLQPWLAEGISRRQWERRRRKIAALTRAPAPTSSAVTRA